MSETVAKDGSCLCGSIRIHVAKRAAHVGACHCGMCRKWGGGPLLAIDCGTEVSFEGEENISVYDSSDWAERGFCKQCGSHLFYRLKETRQYFVPAGLLDGSDDLVFDHQVFIDRKPPYYSFANQTQDMTEAEVFEKFAPPT